MTEPRDDLDGRTRALPESVLALDLGGTQLRTAVAYRDGTLRGRRATRTPRSASEIVAAVVSQLRETLHDADSEEGHAHPALLAISAPGPLDPFNGVLLHPPNMDRSLWGFPLAKEIGQGIGLPAVLALDTHVAALAEGAFGAALGISEYLYITVSTGIGGGIVTGGQLMRGADGLAGEVGHLTIDFNGPLCGCGMPGHLEAYTCGTGIRNRAREQGLTRADGSAAEARDVAEMEDAGNETAHRIMETARQAFAAAIVSIVDVLNPRRIVVGGGIANAQGDRLLNPAREALKRSGYRRQAEAVDLVPAQLGDDVGLIGGLSLAALARVGDH